MLNVCCIVLCECVPFLLLLFVKINIFRKTKHTITIIPHRPQRFIVTKNNNKKKNKPSPQHQLYNETHHPHWDSLCHYFTNQTNLHLEKTNKHIKVGHQHPHHGMTMNRHQQLEKVKFLKKNNHQNRKNGDIQHVQSL